MRTARPLGLSPDGKSLIVVLEDGEQVAVPVDDRLRAAVRNDRARMGQLEIEMESALRPRDIQARIRAGESLESVAQVAGVPIGQIEPFAAPVIAERDHIAGLAQANPVRRAGDAVAHRSLRAVVTDRLLSRGVDVDSADWDAWRNEDRRWTVRLSYESGSAHRQAEFTYDQTGRFSVAANDDARWLTGEHSSSHGPQPGRKRHEADEERTLDLNDELAIVRAIQPQFAVTPDIDDDDAEDQSSTPDNEDAYAEGDLAEVNGVYDIIPGDRSNMDVLYDMLSSFDEDSVQIYAGLVRPTPDQDPTPVIDPPAEIPTAVVIETVSVIEVMPGESVAPVEAAQLEDEAQLEDDPQGRAAPSVVAAVVDLQASEYGDDGDQAVFAEVPIIRSPNADEPFEEEPDDDDGGPASMEPAYSEVVTAVIEPEATEPESTEPEATEPEVAAPEATEPEVTEPLVAAPEATEPEVTEPEVAAPEADQTPQADVPHTEPPAEQPRPAPAKRPTGRRRPAAHPATEPEQPSLVDEAANEPSRPIKRKRASVPSWDEIMFGAPTPKPED
ncbi:MAG: DUF3071 domain-containing protein [Micropruina sp.]|nr:DUF3071 domain-containing protein [Micropruina sp.]